MTIDHFLDLKINIATKLQLLLDKIFIIVLKTVK
jgi:hypothetical protein